MPEILQNLGVFTIGAGWLTWLGKSVLTRYLDRDIQNYKTKLEASNQVELEKLKSELNRRALEHEVKYKRIDEKIANHLIDVYLPLYELYDTVSNYVNAFEQSDVPTKPEQFELARNANNEFWHHFRRNRIYIPPELYQQIEVVARLLKNIMTEFKQGYDRAKNDHHWMLANKELGEEGIPMFDNLVAEIQQRLGVEDLPGVEPVTR